MIYKIGLILTALIATIISSFGEVTDKKPVKKIIILVSILLAVIVAFLSFYELQNENLEKKEYLMKMDSLNNQIYTCNTNNKLLSDEIKDLRDSLGKVGGSVDRVEEILVPLRTFEDIALDIQESWTIPVELKTGMIIEIDYGNCSSLLFTDGGGRTSIIDRKKIKVVNTKKETLCKVTNIGTRVCSADFSIWPRRNEYGDIGDLRSININLGVENEEKLHSNEAEYTIPFGDYNFKGSWTMKFYYNNGCTKTRKDFDGMVVWYDILNFELEKNHIISMEGVKWYDIFRGQETTYSIDFKFSAYRYEYSEKSLTIYFKDQWGEDRETLKWDEGKIILSNFEVDDDNNKIVFSGVFEKNEHGCKGDVILTQD